MPTKQELLNKISELESERNRVLVELQDLEGITRISQEVERQIPRSMTVNMLIAMLQQIPVSANVMYYDQEGEYPLAIETRNFSYDPGRNVLFVNQYGIFDGLELSTLKRLRN